MNKKLVVSLIGMTGCGKSTVGRIAAEKLGMIFFDLDDEIIQGEHRAISDIFSKDGEAAFRNLEKKYLEKIILDSDSDILISCGGGAPIFDKTREILQKYAFNVWIKREPEEVLKNPDVLKRPPVSGEPQRYYDLLASRDPIYTEISNAVIENRCAENAANNLTELILNTKNIKDKGTQK